MVTADLSAPDRDSRIYPPGFAHSTPIGIIHKGMSLWESKDITGGM
jgi:hypothetical protein